MAPPPPHNIEAEQSVLAAIVLDNDALGVAADMLKPEDFYKPSHRVLFSAMAEMFGRDEPVDLVTLTDHLETTRNLKQAGGRDAVANLTGRVSTSANIEYWARIVKNTAALRQYIQAAENRLVEARALPEDVESFLANAAGDILSVSAGTDSGNFRSLGDIYTDIFKDVEQVQETGSASLGVLTGTVLDSQTMGFRGGEMILLAGYTNSGKTAMALNWATYSALAEDKKVAFLSLEMNDASLVERVIAMRSELPKDKFRGSMMSPNDWSKLVEFGDKYHGKDLWVCDSPRLSMNQLRAKLYTLKTRLQGLDLVIIDYFQKIEPERQPGRSRQQELGVISRETYSLAKQIACPVIVVCQLNREMIRREDKRPRLGDLREAGDPEQDADMVISVHRPAQFDDERDPNMMEVSVLKGRDISGGGVHQMRWVPEYLKVEDQQPAPWT